MSRIVNGNGEGQRESVLQNQIVEETWYPLCVPS